MGKREAKRKLHVCVLHKIKEKKDVLFGAFSNQLTKSDKTKAWKAIYEYAISIGAVTGKDPHYMRDIWWPNLKKTTVAKKDNAQLNEADEIILEIIGKDTPVLSFGNLSEETREDQFQKLLQDSMEVSYHSPIEDTEQTNSSNNSDLSNVQWRRKAPKIKPEQPEAATQLPTHSTDVKQQLQIELLNLQIYKTKLEARKLELALGLPNSKFTEEIPVDFIELAE